MNPDSPIFVPSGTKIPPSDNKSFENSSKSSNPVVKTKSSIRNTSPIAKFNITYSREFPSLLPSVLKLKSLDGVKTFIELYLFFSEGTARFLIDDEIKYGDSKSTDDFDFDWVLNIYELCYDKKNIYCGSDVLAFHDPTIIMATYRHIIKVIDELWVKIKGKSELSNFNYLDKRLTKATSYVRKRYIVKNNPNYHRDSGSSYITLIADRFGFSGKSYMGYPRDKFPSYLKTYKLVQIINRRIKRENNKLKKLTSVSWEERSRRLKEYQTKQHLILEEILFSDYLLKI